MKQACSRRDAAAWGYCRGFVAEAWRHCEGSVRIKWELREGGTPAPEVTVEACSY